MMQPFEFSNNALSLMFAVFSVIVGMAYPLLLQAIQKIDEFYNYQFGKLNYRTVRFETEIIDKPNYQGNAVVNYTEREVPYTRVIEHKHFEMFGQDVYECPKTVISKEFSTEWKDGMEPYYPVNDKQNSELYAKYKGLADKEENVIFGGRLAEYKYYDMAPIIEKVMERF